MRKVLTSREQVIHDLLVEGISPKEIAYKLNISNRTVDFHRNNVYKKLEVHSIQELLAKYDSAGQPKGAVSSTEYVNCAFCKYKKWEPKRIISLGILIYAVSMLFVWLFFIKPSGVTPSGSFASAEKPLKLTLNDNEPWGYVLFYPFIENNARITAGDIYTLSYSFVSDVDIDILYVFFFDRTDEEQQYNVRLSSDSHIKNSINANIEYTGYVTVIATKTASSTDPDANLLVINALPYTGNQPTLTFSIFEIVKNN